jgi:hypothetical protein
MSGCIDYQFRVFMDQTWEKVKNLQETSENLRLFTTLKLELQRLSFGSNGVFDLK